MFILLFVSLSIFTNEACLTCDMQGFELWIFCLQSWMLTTRLLGIHELEIVTSLFIWSRHFPHPTAMSEFIVLNVFSSGSTYWYQLNLNPTITIYIQLKKNHVLVIFWWCGGRKITLFCKSLKTNVETQNDKDFKRIMNLCSKLITVSLHNIPSIEFLYVLGLISSYFHLWYGYEIKNILSSRAVDVELSLLKSISWWKSVSKCCLSSPLSAISQYFLGHLGIVGLHQSWQIWQALRQEMFHFEMKEKVNQLTKTNHRSKKFPT